MTTTLSTDVNNVLATVKFLIDIIDFPNLILMVSMSLLVLVLISWHRDNTTFDFRKALLDPKTNAISYGRLGHFVSLVVTTAVLLHQTAKGVLNEWLFIGYMTAWAGTFVASKTIDYKAAVANKAAGADSDEDQR